MAAHCQLRCTQPAIADRLQLHTFRTPAICHPSFDLSAQLQSDSCTSWQSVGFGCSWSAAACQLGCQVPTQLPSVSSGAHLSTPRPVFSRFAISWLGCSQSALLHSVNCSSACLMSVQLQSVSSFAICHVSCNLFCSVMMCQLGSSL